MKQKLIKIASTCFFVFMIAVCFAETYSQKGGLFKIDVPNGWSWIEPPGEGRIRIENPERTNGISIQFKPTSILPEEKVKELLKTNIQIMIKDMVEPKNGTVLGEKERRIGGANARQLDFLLSLRGEIGHVVYIAIINKDYAFTITFGGPKEEKLEMEKIVESIQFQ